MMDARELAIKELMHNFVVSVMRLGYTEKEARQEIQNLIKSRYMKKEDKR